MKNPTNESAQSFRECLASAADFQQPDGQTGFDVVRRVRLVERDHCVGRLIAGLRLTLPDRGPATRGPQ